MRALSGQERPRAPYASTVERRAVRMFAVSVLVVTVPGWSEWRVDLEKEVYNTNGVANSDIVRSPKTKPNQRQRVRTNNILRGKTRSAGSAACRKHTLHFGAFVPLWSDANIIAIHPCFFGELCPIDITPALNVVVPGIRNFA